MARLKRDACYQYGLRGESFVTVTGGAWGFSGRALHAGPIHCCATFIGAAPPMLPNTWCIGRVSGST